MTARGSARRRIVAAVGALVVAAGLSVYPLGAGRPANAAVDPITGYGTTDSVATLRWADGITSADNKPIPGHPRQPSGSSAFYNDLWTSYQNLAVTVSQTKSLTHQSVQISWTGGAPTNAAAQLGGDYLQIMQCYGDSSGPRPEYCQWGGFDSNSLPVGNGAATQEDRRDGNLCDASTNLLGCDPTEPIQQDHQPPVDIVPSRSRYVIPFIPAGTSQKIYQQSASVADRTAPAWSTYFQGQSTNEVPVAVTSQDGTGQISFEVQTGREASGLRCGDANPATGGTPRDCWLVIVPRGMFSPSGRNQDAWGVTESALGASNWAQRLQFHLGFLPTSNVCPQDTLLRPVVGTELAANLMASWQPALCQHGGAVYSFTSTADGTNAVQLASALPGAPRIALTTQPVTFADQGPPLLYAPVAVTGLTLALNIDKSAGPEIQQVRRLNLTPLMLAKTLTQSYKDDLPGRASHDAPPPDWMKTVIADESRDPQWQALNSGIVRNGSSGELMPMTTMDQSAVNQMVWSWIQSDPGTRAWLRGTPDVNGMVVNPNYQKLNLGDPPPATTYARADPTCYRPPDISVDAPKDACITSVDYAPYATNLDDSAVHVQRAFTTGRSSTWLSTEMAPDGTAGYWGKGAPDPIGRRFSWGITATPYSARYGLPTASLCLTGFSADSCVAPTAASLAAAVAAAKPDSTGLLHVDPANPGDGGYPLTEIVYAVVNTNQDAAGLRDSAALLEYAAGAGQTSGVAPGQLPPGYLALPDSLRAQAASAATTLRELANARPSSSPSPTAGQPTSGATSAGTPNGGPSPSAAPISASPGGVVSQPPAGLAARSTPGDALGVIRWVLVAALVASAGGGLGGVLLRHPPNSLTRLLRRTR